MYIILVFIVLYLAEIFYFKIADKYNVIDKPNERSSHNRITLRGGGIVFYIGTLTYFFFSGLQYPWFMIGLTLIAFISFVDDIKTASKYTRLLFHFSALALLFYQWNLFSLPWWTLVVALIFCTAIINAYNFMDGINGITGGYSFVALAVLLYINRYVIKYVDNDLLLAILASILVFSSFNFRKKAICFAGDVGSVSIAFILLFFMGLLIIKTGDFSYIVLLAVYGTDTVLTVIHRLLLRENISLPHRKHLYQIMANELKMSHVKVSLIYMAVQAFISIGYFFCISYRYEYLLLILVLLSVIYVLFMKKYYYLHIAK
ncbi:glycosyltransferase family 4 protein [uncultured Bacteroides sp.]|uniref:MraY family glycosyltransferase n=1 Tax=uncultured Bacteroides sp. TaxID=162156 RepID=UPI00280BDA3C|nr:glycosyltransferase family 4 protein [uncultured Bacteroides sp.]